MTNQQILKKAIEKAKKNGFKYAPYQVSDGIHPTITTLPEISIYRHIISSRSFAKAIWGEEKLRYDITTKDKGLFKGAWAWQYHLQIMVLEEEPLKYLEKFL